MELIRSLKDENRLGSELNPQDELYFEKKPIEEDGNYELANIIPNVESAGLNLHMNEEIDNFSVYKDMKTFYSEKNDNPLHYLIAEAEKAPIGAGEDFENKFASNQYITSEINSLDKNDILQNNFPKSINQNHFK